MGRFIVNLKDGEKDGFMLWSTVVDAPVMLFDNESEIEEYTRREFGKSGLSELAERMERVKTKGTSSLNDGSAEETVSWNRAGKDETCLSIEQLIEFYIRRRGEGEQPTGRSLAGE